MWFSSSLVLVLSVLLLAAQPSTTGFKKPDLVEFDGEKNPELLPEYLIWRSGLRLLSQATSIDDSLIQNVNLAGNEAELVLREAKAQRDRDSACESEQHRVINSLKSANPEQVAAKVNDVVLECRWQVLYAKQRLVDALSVEGQIALSMWINNRRSSIKVLVPRHELDFFRLPR